MSAIIPIPRIPITIRPATIEDLLFIDGLQKLHTKQVGWFPTKAIEGKIEAGHVLVAEGRRDEGTEEQSGNAGPSVPLSLRPSVPSAPLGYVIGNDQYFKRDDVGIIYQMNVVPNRQRGLIGATLVKAMFDRAAYGCRLYCCWCAQDIEANRFWEAMGFVPLAFRAGSAQKARVHIFWQRRIREGDVTTPWWFPAQTSSGSIREDRIVLPIPPGKHWSDEMPRILPEDDVARASRRCLPDEKKNATGETPVLRTPTRHRVQFGRPSAKPQPAPASPTAAKKEKPKKPKVKNDPRLLAAARELRDRWLERVNGNPSGLTARGKYEVCRQIQDTSVERPEMAPRNLLTAA